MCQCIGSYRADLAWEHIIVKLMPNNWSYPLQWRHNERDVVSNHQPRECLLNRLFMRISKKTPKLRVTGLCVGNSPVTGEFPAQRASNAENVSIWWRHHKKYEGGYWTLKKHVMGFTVNSQSICVRHKLINMRELRISKESFMVFL